MPSKEEKNFAYIDELKRTDAPIAYLNDQKLILQIKEKAPDADKTA